jgi:hypothetical protein
MCWPILRWPDFSVRSLFKTYLAFTIIPCAPEPRISSGLLKIMSQGLICHMRSSCSAINRLRLKATRFSISNIEYSRSKFEAMSARYCRQAPQNTGKAKAVYSSVGAILPISRGDDRAVLQQLLQEASPAAGLTAAAVPTKGSPPLKSEYLAGKYIRH